MRPFAIQTGQRGLRVCLLVTFASPAKTAEPIKCGLGCWLDGVEIPAREGAIFGVVRPTEKH